MKPHEVVIVIIACIAGIWLVLNISNDSEDICTYRKADSIREYKRAGYVEYIPFCRGK